MLCNCMFYYIIIIIIMLSLFEKVKKQSVFDLSND
ncbi:MAG: hypothetical protein PWP09_1809 [Thermotogota bacterium]|nr:hypothetical protein [Thermotogota bacterium]